MALLCISPSSSSQLKNCWSDRYRWFVVAGERVSRRSRMYDSTYSRRMRSARVGIPFDDRNSARPQPPTGRR